MTPPSDRDDTRWARALLEQLSPSRRAHCERVADWSRRLVGEESPTIAEAAYFAGLVHDVARELSAAELLRAAAELGVPVGPLERAAPILLHGPVASAWMARDNIGEADSREAVAYHTTGAPGLGVIGQAVFVADGTEPGRRYPEAPMLLHLALEDLSAGYAAVLSSTADYLRTRGLEPHPLTMLALAAFEGTSPAAGENERGTRPG